MKTFKTALLVGSLRKESLNKKMAEAIIELLPENITAEIITIGDLPLYNEDLEKEVPAEWTRFRKEMNTFDSLLFITPEYNRSVPGVLKNALDVGSRPYGKSIWDKKPGAVVSVSPGAIAGFGANHHLRQSLVFLNVPCMQQPEAYIGQAAELFDDAGKFKDPKSADFIKKFIAAFAKWIENNAVS